MGELRGEGGVAFLFGGEGEKAGGGGIVRIHGQRLAESFGIGDGAGGHPGDQIAAEFVDGFGWEDHRVPVGRGA